MVVLSKNVATKKRRDTNDELRVEVTIYKKKKKNQYYAIHHGGIERDE